MQNTTNDENLAGCVIQVNIRLCASYILTLTNIRLLKIKKYVVVKLTTFK